MTVELIPLVMLVVGLVLVGMGITRIARYGRRGLGSVARRGLGYARNVGEEGVRWGLESARNVGRPVGEYASRVSSSAKESFSEFGLSRRYRELPALNKKIEDLDKSILGVYEMAVTGDMPQYEVKRHLSELRQHRNDLVTLRDSIAMVHTGTDENPGITRRLGAGLSELGYTARPDKDSIFGERKGGYYEGAKELLGRVGFPDLYVKAIGKAVRRVFRLKEEE